MEKRMDEVWAKARIGILLVAAAVLVVVLWGCAAFTPSPRYGGLTPAEGVGSVIQTTGETVGGPLGAILAGAGGLLAAGGAWWRLRKADQTGQVAHSDNVSRIADLERRIAELAKPTQ